MQRMRGVFQRDDEMTNEVLRQEREQFEAWWYASKYCQVPGYPEKEWQQIAWDGWQSARAAAPSPTMRELTADEHAALDAALMKSCKVVAAPAEPAGRIVMYEVSTVVRVEWYCDTPPPEGSLLYLKAS